MFDGWAERLKWHAWQEAFAESGLDPSFYACRRRAPSEVTPWGHLHCGVEDEFLKSEWTRATEGAFTLDCRSGECLQCGACERGAVMTLSDPSFTPLPLLASREVVRKRPWVQKIRCQFIKVGEAKFLGHLEMIDVFVRAVRRACIPMQFSEGFHPLPKISFTNPIAVGLESLAEYMDLELAHYIKAREFQERLNRALPSGLRIIDASEMSLKGRPLPTVFKVDRFLISLEHLRRNFSEEALKDKLRKTLAKGECILVQEKKQGPKRLDALPFIERLQVVKSTTYAPSCFLRDGAPSLRDLFKADFLIEMGIKKEGGVRPTAILQRILELTFEEASLLRVVKVESLPPLS
jgi:radical SAM-linked protein